MADFDDRECAVEQGNPVATHGEGLGDDTDVQYAWVDPNTASSLGGLTHEEHVDKGATRQRQ